MIRRDRDTWIGWFSSESTPTEVSLALGLEAGSEAIVISGAQILRNPPPARLYERAIAHEGAAILSNGALATISGEKTGRSPQDKRIIEGPEISNDVWWGSVNFRASPQTGIGSRMRLSQTRSMIDAIHSGALDGVHTFVDPLFGLRIQVSCPGVPASLLNPRETWPDTSGYDESAQTLASGFHDKFVQYADEVPPEVRQAGPRI